MNCMISNGFIIFTYLCPQITTNQKNARRWESDNDVAACNGCDKQFSLKIRKVGSPVPLHFP